MTPKEQNLAIAQACGWPAPFKAKNHSVRRLGSCLPEEAIPEYIMCGMRNGGVVEIPDYCNDLNAMHEAEKTLDYGDKTWLIGGYSLYVQALPHGEEISATAAQRAEAFLRATKLWKEQ